MKPTVNREQLLELMSDLTEMMVDDKYPDGWVVQPNGDVRYIEEAQDYYNEVQEEVENHFTQHFKIIYQYESTRN